MKTLVFQKNANLVDEIEKVLIICNIDPGFQLRSLAYLLHTSSTRQFLTVVVKTDQIKRQKALDSPIEIIHLEVE
jgi:hypothetical protein